MTNMEHWTDRLSEYVDGDLDAVDRAALEAHMAICGECRSTVNELRQVVTAASELPDREPGTDLFPGIMERIGEGDDGAVVPLRPGARVPRRFTFSAPQLAAAAAVIMTLSAGAVWFAMRPASPPAGAVATGQPANGEAVTDPTLSPGLQAGTAAQFVSDTRVGYEAAISRLEQVLAEQYDRLDPETVEVIQRNLATIDTAIAEARTALENDPSNAYLYRHLDNTMSKKVELLRRATRRATT